MRTRSRIGPMPQAGPGATGPGRSWKCWRTISPASQPRPRARANASTSTPSPERARGSISLTGEEFPGSARIALEARDGAGFTKYRYFEMGRRAADLQSRLRADYPGRDIKVYEGDCNATILEALKELRPLNWAPTFAFLDPRRDGACLDHAGGARRPQARLPPEPHLDQARVQDRAVDALPDKRDRPHARAGGKGLRRRHCASQSPLWHARLATHLRPPALAGTITPAEGAREEYVNLMRWRLQRVLGYGFAHPFELKNSEGQHALPHDLCHRQRRRYQDHEFDLQNGSGTTSSDEGGSQGPCSGTAPVRSWGFIPCTGRGLSLRATLGAPQRVR